MVGPVTVSVAAPDVPPPGAGVKTVTLCVPPLARSVAGSAAVSCVVDTKLVVRGTPLTCTTAPDTNLVPVTVSVNAALPAATLAGISAVIVGTGLATVTGLLVVVASRVNVLWANHRASH